MIASDRARRSGARHGLRAGITDVRAWLAAAGLALYVILRLAYSTFYQPLGVSPEDLGFGYLDILSQAAVGFVVLVLVFGLLFVPIGVLLFIDVVLVAALVKTVWSLVREVGSWLKGLIRRGAKRTGGDKPQAEGGSPDAASEESSAGSPFVGDSAAGLLESEPSEQPASNGEACDRSPKMAGAPRRAAVGRWVGVGYIAVVCVLVAAVTILQAGADRRAVERGEPRFPTLMGFRIASWGAHRATVKAVAENSRPDVAALEAVCLLYLGTHDGTVFLYDPRSHATVRVPAASVLVDIHKSGTCSVEARR